jgi:hypothetical protein
MAVEYKRITCAGCGAEVDKVEYDPDAANPAVAAVVAALGVDEEAALRLVKRHNPDAAVDPVESATALADQIAAKSVPDRDESTYACPQGCDTTLEVK